MKTFALIVIAAALVVIAGSPFVRGYQAAQQEQSNVDMFAQVASEL